MDVRIHQIRENAEELRTESRKLSAYEDTLTRISRSLAGSGEDEWSADAAACADLAARLSEEGALLGRHADILSAAAGIYEAHEKAAGRYGARNLPAVREYLLDDVRKIMRRYTDIRAE